MRQYDHITRQFSKFFHEEELQSRLAQKVDSSDFNQMIERKASRDELNQAMGVIDTLFDRLRLLALM